jgi:hypothetical protein
MNIRITFDNGWWTVSANGIEVDAFQSKKDATIYAAYYRNKMTTATPDYNRGTLG